MAPKPTFLDGQPDMGEAMDGDQVTAVRWDLIHPPAKPAPSKVDYIDNDLGYSRYATLEPDSHEIRVLKILPAEEHEDITIILLRTTVKNGVRSRALSYTWGDMTDTRRIRVRFKDVIRISQASSLRDLDMDDSSEDSVEFDVTANLHKALNRFRTYDQEPVLYWIDALCINQSDPEERSQQVLIMKEIYASASRVDVWLDCDSASTEAWLANENAELLIFMAALRDRGLEAGPVSKGKRSLSYILMEFFNRLYVYEQRFPGKDPNDADSRVEEESKIFDDPLAPEHAPFFSVLVANLDKVKKCHYAATYDRPVEPRAAMACERFITWIFGMYKLSTNPVMLNAIREYLDVVLRQGSEVWSYVYDAMILWRQQGLPEKILRAEGHEKEKLQARSKLLVRRKRLPCGERLERMYHEYFNRVWVLQEVFSHPNACVREGGGLVADFATFQVLKALEHMRITYATSDATSGMLLYWEGSAATRTADFWLNLALRLEHDRPFQRELLLRNVVQETGYLGATNPRDIVIAVYQLATDVALSSFEPNYGSSVAETYARFTRSVIEATGRLDILCDMWLQRGKATSMVLSRRWDEIEGLPSWTPNFLGIMKQMDEYPRSASKDTQVVLAPSTDAMVLSLKGFSTGTVEFVMDPDPDRRGKSLAISDLYSYLDRAYGKLRRLRCEFDDCSFDYADQEHLPLQQLADVFFNGSPSLLSALWFKQEIDSGQFDASVIKLDSLKMVHETGRKQLLTAYKHLLASNPTALTGLASQAEKSYKRFVSGYFVMLTRDGDFGICPPHTHKGDVIVTFPGSAMPFALSAVQAASPDSTSRSEGRRSSSPTQWRFLGPCVVHGQMNGEAMRRVDLDPSIDADVTSKTTTKSTSSSLGCEHFRMSWWELR